MIIIGVDNTFNLGRETIFFLKSLVDKQHVRYVHLVASSSKCQYRTELKSLINAFISEGDIKLCIIEFTRQSIGNLRNIHFDGIVFYDERISHKKYLSHHIYSIKNKLKKIISCETLILPDTTYVRLNEDICYGWSKNAHISLTSSEEGLGGKLYVQCILQHPISAMKDAFSTPREFGISAKARYPEQLLAAIAILMLLQAHLNKSEFNLV